MLRTPGRSTAREWRWNRAWKLCRGVHLPSRVSCEDSPRAAVKPLSSQKFVHFAKLATSSIYYDLTACFQGVGFSYSTTDAVRAGKLRPSKSYQMTLVHPT